MTRYLRTGRRSVRNGTRFCAFFSSLRGVLVGLLLTSVLAAGNAPGATPARADDLPAILHTLFSCSPSSPSPHSGQRVAVPSYFYPGQSWETLGDGFPTAGLAIINPSSGAGPSLNNVDVQNYIAQVATLRAQVPEMIVLGYVYTDYGKRSLDEDRPATADTPFLRSVKHDIDRYYEWYGVDGIFFDEASTDESMVPYYQEIHDYVKGKTGTCGVVINPGTRTKPAYMTAADIVVNFEGYYSSYVSDDFWNGQVPDWELTYPAYRFWHMVHTAPGEADMLNAIDLSKTKQRYADWVYVTDDVMDNPWNVLPTYWDDELDAAEAL